MWANQPFHFLQIINFVPFFSCVLALRNQLSSLFITTNHKKLAIILSSQELIRSNSIITNWRIRKIVLLVNDWTDNPLIMITIYWNWCSIICANNWEQPLIQILNWTSSRLIMLYQRYASNEMNEIFQFSLMYWKRTFWWVIFFYSISAIRNKTPNWNTIGCAADRLRSRELLSRLSCTEFAFLR